jgi:hypothetical protein
LSDKIDVGVGSQVALTGNHFWQDRIRTELRIRF